MKIAFTADIHIKLGQKNVPVEWATNRYKLLIEQLCNVTQEQDLLVIGGDIFDKHPTVEELEIYFELVYAIKCPCIIYDGNHEATKKGKTFFTNLKAVTNRLNSNVLVIDTYHSIENLDFIPYCKLKEFEPEDFTGNILFTHVRGAIEPHVKPEIDLDLLNRWELVVAGDLHSYDNCQRNILYPGSPATTSFHRSLTDSGIIFLDSVTLQHEWRKLEVPQLIRKSITAGDPMPATEYHHTIYEVEGDMTQLGAMQDSDLIDKKVVKRESDTALMLDSSMSLTQELQEYLLYILQLPENTVADLLDIFNNNLSKIEE
jgi:DNA repair exonuclease SbcCD nuclease subunit